VSRFFAVCFAQILLVGSICVANAQSVTWPQQPRRPYGVPEASLPCTPEEQTWWTELRAASDNIKYPHRHPGEKEKKKFLDLLRDGIKKSYKPPVPDARPVFLFKTEPSYTEQARKREINGTVTLQVELLANGSVGTIEVIQGLPQGLNDAAADAARKTIFLPAVKNRQFVTASTKIEMTFNIY
jgi:TonB family protein